jgi:hypothetical protein
VPLARSLRLLLMLVVYRRDFIFVLPHGAICLRVDYWPMNFEPDCLFDSAPDTNAVPRQDEDVKKLSAMWICRLLHHTCSNQTERIFDSTNTTYIILLNIKRWEKTILRQQRGMCCSNMERRTGRHDPNCLEADRNAVGLFMQIDNCWYAASNIWPAVILARMKLSLFESTRMVFVSGQDGSWYTGKSKRFKQSSFHISVWVICIFFITEVYVIPYTAWAGFTDLVYVSQVIPLTPEPADFQLVQAHEQSRTFELWFSSEQRR